jgi:hypothetical protein
MGFNASFEIGYTRPRTLGGVHVLDALSEEEFDFGEVLLLEFTKELLRRRAVGQ